MTATINRNRVFKARVDGEMETFTRDDVRRYFSYGHGPSGVRSFGSVHGDWRMIDSIAQAAAVYFGMDVDYCPKEG